jgi:FkbM family methyltransferase
MRALLRSRPVARAVSPVLHPVLRRFSLEQIAGSRILSLAVRAPAAEPWFQVRLPGGQAATFSSRGAPLLYWAGLRGFEPDLVPAFLARIGAARTFVDVGANFGFYAIVACMVNPVADVHAVEPDGPTAALLRETLTRNGLDLPVHQVALSDRGGEAQMSTRGGLSSLVESRWQTDERLETVRMQRFDDLFPDGADLVKIDVEGAEALVLAGMEQTIVRSRPTILCEVAAETADEVADFARAHGYRVLGLPGERAVDRIVVPGDSVNVVLEPQVG